MATTDSELEMWGFLGEPNVATAPSMQRWVDSSYTSSRAPVNDLNKTARSIEIAQSSIAGNNKVIPIHYGTTLRSGVLVVGIVQSSSVLYISGVIGVGPLGAINAVCIDDVVTTFPVEAYLGTQTEASAALVAAWSANGVTYNDVMAGTAYIVIAIPSDNQMSAFPKLTVEHAGMIISDPRGASQATDNPAVCCADFITNEAYGMGEKINVASVITAANFCDEAMNDSTVRRRMSLSLLEPQTIESWLQVFGLYSACTIVKRGDEWFMLPQRPAMSIGAALTKKDMITGSFTLSEIAQHQSPNVVTIKYTNTAVRPWQTISATVESGAVAAGAPRREQTVAAPGILYQPQATRDATQRLNQFTLTNFEAAWSAFDDALTKEIGDVFPITFPEYGLDGTRKFWISDLADQGFGRWRVSAREYNVDAFTDSIVINPPPVDVGSMLPGTIITLSGVPTGIEELYQKKDGSWSSRVRFTWTPAPQQNVFSYYATIITDVTDSSPGFAVATANVPVAELVTYALQEGRSYRLQVVAVSVLQAVSNAIVSEAILVLGKLAPPGNVAVLNGVETNGAVNLWWTPAVDIDIRGYIVKRSTADGLTSQAWADMQTINRVDALAYFAPDQPVGTYCYAVKAYDSVNKESVLEARRVIRVTANLDQINTAPRWFTSYTLTNFAQWPSGNVTIFENTNLAGVWGDEASVPDDTVGTFNDVLRDTIIAAPTHVPALLVSNTIDFGSPFQGTWSLGGQIVQRMGSATLVHKYIELSLDNITFTQIADGTLGTGRYARMRLVVDAT